MFVVILGGVGLFELRSWVCGWNDHGDSVVVIDDSFEFGFVVLDLLVW